VNCTAIAELLKNSLGSLKCFSKPRWWWDKIVISLAYGSNSV